MSMLSKLRESLLEFGYRWIWVMCFLQKDNAMVYYQFQCMAAQPCFLHPPILTWYPQIFICLGSIKEKISSSPMIMKWKRQFTQGEECIKNKKTLPQGRFRCSHWKMQYHNCEERRLYEWLFDTLSSFWYAQCTSIKLVVIKEE